MNNFTLLPPVGANGETTSPSAPQQAEITAIMHELKNQVCTVGLAVAALKYPDETEDDRQRHFASLEAVISAMNRQFHRLEDWLVEAGYRGRAGQAVNKAGRRRATTGLGRAAQIPAVRVIQRPVPPPLNNDHER